MWTVTYSTYTAAVRSWETQQKVTITNLVHNTVNLLMFARDLFGEFRDHL